ncbi:hypothetical protein BGZ94_003798 [Podila epigama]|nr:hypothetical protein BGZ94_003798 [Podila epigama]
MVKSIVAFAATALALASSVSAQALFYTQPVTGTKWTAGKSATVSWNNRCSDFIGNTTFPIALNHQVGQYQVPVPGVGPIGYLDCAKTGSTTVQIPATVPQGNTYSILVINGVQSYSAHFTIESTVPGPNTTVSALPTSTIAPTTTFVLTTTTTTAAASATTSLPPVVTEPANKPNNAGALKASSTVALVVLGAVASMMLYA